MEYWTQLYLKEGMARFMEFVGIDTLFPEWNAWTEFVQDVYGTAMGLDSMESSHPIEVEVHHPDEIAEIFDSISYAKGASIIRMIASHVGMDTFFDGMRLYLTRHAYGNTVTNDLWKALEEVSGKPVVMFMQAWTLESGYPILELWDDGTINVERYLAAGRNAIDSSDKPKTRWSIPVTARVEGFEKVQGPWVIDGPNGDEKDALSFKIKEWCEAGKWFKLNVDQTGFYRVRYSKKQSACLTAVMKPGSALTTIDRLGLISDSFAAGKAGYAQIADALELINSFGEHEVAEYPVWQELSENLASLATMIRSEPYFHRFQDLLRGLYSRQMDLLGWVAKSGEDSRTGTLRATTIGMLAIADDPCVLRKAYDEFMAFRRDPAGAPIAGDLQKTIFRCALKYDESTVYNELKQLYEKSSFPEEQRNCLSVLGCVKNSGLHREMLHYAFHSGNVRSQDIAFLLGSLATSTDEGGRASWKYFQDNFSILYTKYGSGPVWGTCVALSCRGLRTIIEADQVEEFFRDPSHSVGAVKRRLMQSLEAVRTMAVRRDRDRNALQEYFQ
jgi:puromycin-sensitive aminopeptidase